MIVGVIPARAGSKGIPRKNLRPLLGVPLSMYTFRAAIASELLEEVVVSTDDEQVASLAREAGISVPFLRPSHLATDSAKMEDVLLHVLDWRLQRGLETSALVLLQPTSPFRTAEHIDAAIRLYLEKRPASVVTVIRVPHRYGPESLLQWRDGKLVPLGVNAPTARRQDKPLLFARNGPAVLVVAADALRDQGLYGEPSLGIEMSELDSMDIDTTEDLTLAEFVLRCRETIKNFPKPD